MRVFEVIFPDPNAVDFGWRQRTAGQGGTFRLRGTLGGLLINSRPGGQQSLQLFGGRAGLGKILGVLFKFVVGRLCVAFHDQPTDEPSHLGRIARANSGSSSFDFLSHGGRHLTPATLLSSIRSGSGAHLESDPFKSILQQHAAAL